MAKRHQLFRGAIASSSCLRATIAAEPGELSEDRRRYHQRGGTRWHERLVFRCPRACAASSFAVKIKGDKNHLRDGLASSQGAIAAVHHSHMVAAGRIKAAAMAMDGILQRRLRFAKPAPAGLRLANR